MPKIPKQMTSLWLFPDAMPKQGVVLEFSKFDPALETTTGKKVPTFVMMGSVKLKDKDGKALPIYTGDLTFSSWNVGNLEEIKEQLGEDTDDWTAGQKFRVIPIEEKLFLEALPVEETV